MNGMSNSKALGRGGLLFWAALTVWVVLAVALQSLLGASGPMLVLLVLTAGVVTGLGFAPLIRRASRENTA